MNTLLLNFQLVEIKNTVFGNMKKRNSTSKPAFYRESSVYEPLRYIPEIQPDDPRIEEATKEGNMEIYEETYDDYLEMFIQFGYVVLFSSVYPVAAFWAIFNNLLEIRADAFKLCMVYQRPMSKRVKDIGAWQVFYNFNEYTYIIMYPRPLAVSVCHFSSVLVS